MGRRGPFQGRRVSSIVSRSYLALRGGYPVQRARAREGKARPSASWFHFGLTPLFGPTTPRMQRSWLPLCGAKRLLWGYPKGVPQKWGYPIFGPPGVPRGAPRGGVPPLGGPKRGGTPLLGGTEIPSLWVGDPGFQAPMPFRPEPFLAIFCQFWAKKGQNRLLASIGGVPPPIEAMGPEPRPHPPHWTQGKE